MTAAIDPGTDLRRWGEEAPNGHSRVLEQHVELRRLILEGLELMQAALRGDIGAIAPFRALIETTSGLLTQHLADEEALLIPILEDDCPLGPLQADQLRADHQHQLEDMRILCNWSPERAIGELAARFQDLAEELLGDIETEDRELLAPTFGRDARV